MAASFRNRFVQVNQLVFDQVSIFMSDEFTRITGLDPSDVSLTMFFNNQVASWNLLDGTGIPDGQIAAGHVYWQELSTGAYGIRFYPNSLGHWHLEFSYDATSPNQIVGLDYDVVALPFVESGVRVDFC